MKALITGAGGFIGGYLAEHLLSAGDRVWGMDREPGAVCQTLEQRGLRFVRGDILNGAEMGELLADLRPDVVYHLAAQSFPGRSWEQPALTFDINVRGTVSLLEAVRSSGGKPVVIPICSSAEYAPRVVTTPITEDSPLGPSTPYGVSKLTQDHIARLYGERYGLPVVRVRPFYLVGPRKMGDVCSDFARGVVAVERGAQPGLKVGNLDVIRDLLDVRDGVGAMRVLAEKGRAGSVYNICLGTGYRVGDILDRLIALAGKPVQVSVDPARVRSLDEPVKIGDNRRLRELGWAPRISMEQTLRDILDYWRAA